MATGVCGNWTRQDEEALLMIFFKRKDIYAYKMLL